MKRVPRFLVLLSCLALVSCGVKTAPAPFAASPGASDTAPPPTVTPAPAVPSPTPIPPTPVPPPTIPILEPTPGLPSGPDAVWDLVLIGDSSLWFLGDAYADQIEGDLGVTVELHEFYPSGLGADYVREALNTEDGQLSGLIDVLKGAEVVVLFVNPLDCVDPDKPLDLDGCFDMTGPKACPPESFERYTATLEAIWGRILELRAGQPIILRAMDIYNPLVSPWQKKGIYEACTACSENMSQAARLAAKAYDILFLSRLDALNGLDHSEDPREKGYVLSDGEHLSDVAAKYTAELLSKMGYEPVSPR